MWFWPPEDQRLVAERQRHFDKLYAAYIAEKNRRAAASRPAMPEPPAVDLARQRLHDAKDSLRIAKQRPQQIAAAVRWIGAGCCLLGLIILGATRPRSATPSPSPDE